MVVQQTKPMVGNNKWMVVDSSDGMTKEQKQIEALQKQVAGLSSTVARLSKVGQVDIRERAIQDSQTTRALLQSVFALTQQVQALTNQKQRDEIPAEYLALLETQSYHAQAREKRQREVKENLAYIKRLTECKQVVTPKCPCGKHKGIQLVEVVDKEEHILEENICPKNWWFMLSRLSYEEGRLSEFRKNYPLSEYLFAYTLA